MSYSNALTSHDRGANVIPTANSARVLSHNFPGYSAQTSLRSGIQYSVAGSNPEQANTHHQVYGSPLAGYGNLPQQKNNKSTPSDGISDRTIRIQEYGR